jgi:hypothetical protein
VGIQLSNRAFAKHSQGLGFDSQHHKSERKEKERRKSIDERKDSLEKKCKEYRQTLYRRRHPNGK